jgi:hypothetical protein
VSLILVGQTCRYRIAFNGVETSAQLPIGGETLSIRASALKANQKKMLVEQMRQMRRLQINSAYLVVIDVDSYLEGPKSPEPAEFQSRVWTTSYR